MRKVKLDFDKSGYENEKKQILEIGEILIDAKNELQKLEVECDYKDLMNGNFLDAFHNYHRKQHSQEKDSFAKRLSYEKYIEMLGFDPLKVIELEKEYKARAFSNQEFFSYNDAFYSYCESRALKDTSLQKFLNQAPEKVSFRPIDLFVIKRNKVDVSIDTEWFTTYAINNKQVERMKDIKQFIEVSRKIGLTYDEVYKPIKKYLLDDSYKPRQFQSGKYGLSRDLNEVNFNFNQILIID